MSGGGQISIKKNLFQINAGTVRKKTAPGGEASWAKEVTDWESEETKHIQSLIPEIEIIANTFLKKGQLSFEPIDNQTYPELSEIGTLGRNFRGSSPPYVLKINGLLENKNYRTSYLDIVFKLKAQPKMKAVIEFTQTIKKAIRKTDKLSPLDEASEKYSAYWLSSVTKKNFAFLLTKVNLDQLGSKIAEQPYWDFDFPAFKKSAAVIILVSPDKKILPNSARFLIQHLTKFTFDPQKKLIEITANGALFDKLTYSEMKKSEFTDIINKTADPRTADKIFLSDYATDLEFINTFNLL